MDFATLVCDSLSRLVRSEALAYDAGLRRIRVEDLAINKSWVGRVDTEGG
jgi:hypothetical protein